ncbi:MAG TPA: S8 family serine peptidase [Solirubrobacterales bacterium]|nr:S8 family serine peptidase [Solirubrobacterales bacterium]
MAPFAGALVALGLVIPATAGAAETGVDPLSPELTQLAEPLVAAAPPPVQAEAIGLPAEGPGSLVHEGDRVVVEAHFEEGALARLEALKAAGARIGLASRRYQTVALSVEPEDLEALAEVPGLSSVEPSRAPVVYGAGETVGTATGGSEALCEGGSVISQGLGQMNVAAARAAFGARGAGETIGVLSDSFDAATKGLDGNAIATRASQDEESGDLPGPRGPCGGRQVPVRVIAEGPSAEATDEGRAMLQVVHDLAPHAELAFATAYSTELEFARNIERLAEPVAAGGAGAEVIVDDVGYFAEPFYQEGPVADAVRKVTGEGVVYLTAAGNDNLFESGTGREIASWERSEFHDALCPTVVGAAVGAAAADCMNFSPSGTDTTFGITVERGSQLMIDLQWAEPWYGVKSDLDAYLLSKEGRIVASAGSDNVTEGEPVEVLVWENTGAASAEVQLVVDRCILTCNPAATVGREPRLKFSLMEDGGGVSKTEYPSSNLAAGIVVGPTIYGHAGSPAAITLGAVNYEKSRTAPTEPERYSSRGPVTHYFGPVSGTTPAATLATPEVIPKPNLTATDCASTTFFASHRSDGWHFCGTSEAGPHAAAVAALMSQTAPSATPGSIAAAMESSATPFTVVTAPTAVGEGMLNAEAAIRALGGSAVDDPASAGSGSTEEGAGSGEEGSGATEEGSGSTEERPPGQEPTPPPSPPSPSPAPAPAPTVTITRGPSSLGNETTPTFEFTSNVPASFVCQVDGGTRQGCTSPYTVPPLADGPHGFVVTATDAEGRRATSGIYGFTVDTRAPRTKISGPHKVVRTRKASVRVRFSLRANASPVIFYCQIDREALRICPARFHRRFRPGHHVLAVRAKDEAGNIAVRPTAFRFRVKRIRR